MQPFYVVLFLHFSNAAVIQFNIYSVNLHA